MDRVLAGIRAGESRAVLVRGEPGVGKTALLDYLADQAAACQVVRAAGVESEMELAFAGLHQLCGPLLGLRERLPGPHRDALDAAFGLRGESSPDRFFVGLATLGLLSEAADERPLVCIVDDAQWLDEASAQALAFVARRLSMEAVALVFASRDERDSGATHELVLKGLSDEDSRSLLRASIRVPLDARVRDRIVSESRGNPLALLELPRGLEAAELGGDGLAGTAPPLTGRIEGSFLLRFKSLPPAERQQLLLAAAEPLGDATLLRLAADRLGIALDAVRPGAAVELCEFGSRVRFRHPLVRSAIYRAASAEERRVVHRALADVTDPAVDPDRRAWHRAQAATGDDEDVAAELERSADRAKGRGGFAAAAAFLERAADLSPQPAPRAGRALAAAQAKLRAGAPEAALTLLARAEAGPLDELQQARALLLRAQVSFAAGGVVGSDDAAALLLNAAKRFEPLDIHLARETYLDALCAVLFSGPAAGSLRQADVARAALDATRSPEPPRAAGLLLEGLTTQILSGFTAAVPLLRRALIAFDSDDLSQVEGLSWGWLASQVGAAIWEHDLQHAVATRHVQMAREAGALVVLPLPLLQLAGIWLRQGDRAAVAGAHEEIIAAHEATGSKPAPYLALVKAAYQGSEAEFLSIFEESSSQSQARGNAQLGVHWAFAIFYNALGRHHDALAAAQRAYEDPQPIDNSAWMLHELIEAAALSGRPDAGAAAMRQLSERAQASGTDWALGVEARSRALLSGDDSREALHREAIDRLGGPGTRIEHARAYLIYGEWLARMRRTRAAREALGTAHEMFVGMGVEGFANRAADALQKTGVAVARDRSSPTDGLTPREAQIARLAASGLSNQEIGGRLFLSPRTVEYHLHKVFSKLSISSRRQLAAALPET